MADKKDNTAPGSGKKPAISTSSSLDKPLLEENAKVREPDIDTSHLSIEDASASTSGSLEKEVEADTPAIDISHLSLEEPKGTQRVNEPSQDLDLEEALANGHTSADEDTFIVPPDEIDINDEPLIVKNPLADNATSKSSFLHPSTASNSDNQGEEIQVTLNSGVPDEDFENVTTGDNSPNNSLYDDSDDDDESDSSNPIKSILRTVKKPESIARKAWLNSSFRRFLLDNFDSYRAKDEDQNMEAAFEKIYGGATEKRFDPRKFFKENLLFSFLLFILIFLIGWKAAGIFFPDFMPGINDQIIETVKNTASLKPKAKPKEEKKPVVTNEASKIKIEATLSHCLIEPDAHKQFSSAFTRVGYEFSEPPLALSYDEVVDSIKVWQGMDMGFYIKDAILRYRVLSSLALPVIQEAHQTVDNYNQSLVDIGKQAEDLENRIRSIQTSRGNQSTNTINERIPLRIKLDELKERLAQEPSLERFSQMQQKLTLVENILSGTEKPERLTPDQISETDPDWLVPISNTASADIGILIQEKVVPAIQVPADKLKTVYPKLTAFQLSELDKSLDNVIKLSSLIIFLPENKLIPYRLELSGLNRRLNKLMKQNLPEWLNFNRCLIATRADALAAE